MKNIFVEGPISTAFIADSIQKHAAKTSIGAHDIFLGQVRADIVNDRIVSAIEYTSYQELALQKMQEIREAIFEKYALTCMHVHHSLGEVKAGELCLFVFTSAPHRRAAIDACAELVELIKNELPVWGKEVFDDETHQWKVNKEG
ncbi:molybdenum cofactor biosynthesis protein MoaE [Niabella hibiscisoli]|uniref:molybdenum cofactor biosynthesis protein MoaE n=1 Tax=Niabella hibiscisoli TaxID=1825928 RepID=UPI001F1109AB|nr:molybdenum cofactor biosynthesis protein MoaE [Niabella hibiscisoli]MCH5717675.1 molybdenum cofactor biosynthesis protein MoaE [Niabella hibiscisoli]